MKTIQEQICDALEEEKNLNMIGCFYSILIGLAIVSTCLNVVSGMGMDKSGRIINDR